MGALNNFLSKIFGGRKENTFPKGELVNFMSLFSTNEVRSDLNSTFISCLDTNAQFLCKIKPEVQIKGDSAKNKKDLTYLLSVKPNRIMDAPTFWEAVARSYFENNVAICWVIRDLFSTDLSPIEIYPLDISETGLNLGVNPTDGNLYSSFRINGQIHYASSEDLIIVQRNRSIGELLGKRSKSIDQALKVIAAGYAGAEKAVTESQYIRFIAQGSTQLSDENQKKYNAILQDVLNTAKNGVAVIPSGATLVPANSQGKWLPDADLSGFKSDIYEYFGVNEKIVSAMFTEDDYQSYYERTLEPFCSKLGAQLTIKLLSENEISKGNEIVVPTYPLQTVSIKTRIALATAMEGLPMVVPNDVLSLLYQPTYAGGENPQASLNWVKAQDQSKYQTGTSNGPPKIDSKDD